MNNEYRHRPRRRQVGYNVGVYDTMTETVIGKLSNLSEAGMMLIMCEPMVNDALYQLHFSLPDQLGVMQTIDVGAHELWADEAAVPGQVWIGFRFIDISSVDAGFIRDWVDAPGGHYV